MADIEKVEKFNKSWISLYRKFTEWEWYKNANVMRLFIHCLLMANFKDKKWQGQEIKRGQFVTSVSELAHSLNLTEMKIRTALNKLILTNEITNQTTSQYSIITVNNYNEYQDDNKRFNKPITNEQQTDNKQITTTNNDNNENNDIYTLSLKNFKKENPTFKFWGEFKNIGLTEEQYRSLEVMILSSKKLNQYIEDLSENVASKNEKEFDFEFPDMHKIRIKKYWMSDKNKRRGINQKGNSETKKRTSSQMTDEERKAQIIKELKESGENPDEYFD